MPFMNSLTQKNANLMERGVIEVVAYNAGTYPEQRLCNCG